MLRNHFCQLNRINLTVLNEVIAPVIVGGTIPIAMLALSTLNDNVLKECTMPAMAIFAICFAVRWVQRLTK
jgi:hypothetical protein